MDIFQEKINFSCEQATHEYDIALMFRPKLCTKLMIAVWAYSVLTM